MENGKLYICPTPIGNLEDITLRVLRILEEADAVAAEDTRHTLKLLNHFKLSKHLVSYHEHNKRSAGPKLIERMKNGETIALVSDAGMPGISDPGADLILLCIEEGIHFEVLPGPTALINALVASGLSTEGFMFIGFLERHKHDAQKFLKRIKAIDRTLIFYEAPHRLIHTLECMHDVLGDRRIVISKELTKRYEQHLRCRISEALIHLEKDPPRGEYVLVVEGDDGTEAMRLAAEHDAIVTIAYEEALVNAIHSGEKIKVAASKLSEMYDRPKNVVYQQLLSMKK